MDSMDQIWLADAFRKEVEQRFYVVNLIYSSIQRMGMRKYSPLSHWKVKGLADQSKDMLEL